MKNEEIKIHNSAIKKAQELILKDGLILTAPKLDSLLLPLPDEKISDDELEFYSKNQMLCGTEDFQKDVKAMASELLALRTKLPCQHHSLSTDGNRIECNNCHAVISEPQPTVPIVYGTLSQMIFADDLCREIKKAIKKYEEFLK